MTFVELFTWDCNSIEGVSNGQKIHYHSWCVLLMVYIYVSIATMGIVTVLASAYI